VRATTALRKGKYASITGARENISKAWVDREEGVAQQKEDHKQNEQIGARTGKQGGQLVAFSFQARVLLPLDHSVSWTRIEKTKKRSRRWVGARDAAHKRRFGHQRGGIEKSS